MSNSEKPQPELIHSKIWYEEPEQDDPFTAERCYCSGYDVYGDILDKASWFEYLYLLFKLERPEQWQAKFLEKIAIAIANPGIRDHSVRAAMNAGVGGSTSASALMAALAVGAGHLGGAREIYLMMQWWQSCGCDFEQWKTMIEHPPKSKRANVWNDIEHTPGFDPTKSKCSLPVEQTFDALIDVKSIRHLVWLKEKQNDLEDLTGSPLSMSGLVATAFMDLELSPEQAEMIYLMLRLPGAAAHALEQKKYGWRKYPFFGSALKIINDPKVS